VKQKGMVMPAIDPIKLKRLKISHLLMPFAMKRGLTSAQLGDLVERAMADTRFDLDAATDEFSNFLIDEDDARFWAEDLERLGTAPHLFSVAGTNPKPNAKTVGGYTEAELSKMPPEQRLAIANRVEFERAAAGK
jgi:hypothetical protein